MKKLLFIMNNLHCGGAEKALVSLLQTIDYARWSVDLLLLKREGMFLGQLPGQVRVLEPPSAYPYFDMPIGEAVKRCMAQGQLGVALARLQAGVLFKTDRRPAVREQRLWTYLSRALPKLDRHYDAAVGYLEKTPIYYCVEKVQADVKLGFIHNDYTMLGMDPALDRPWFGKLDYIVTVSDICGEVLERQFPDMAAKVKVMRNIVSPAAIRRLALEPSPSLPRSSGLTIVSVGRLHEQKGFDMAADACRLLLDRGFDVRWYVVGEGEERPKLEAQIARLGIEDRFILLGLQPNPYPLIRQADVYVHPSRYEGKPIAVDEAKILGKPIVVTDFTTARDQIESMANGLVVGMSAEAICDGAARLLGDERLRKAFSERLTAERLGTEDEIERLYDMIS